MVLSEFCFWIGEALKTPLDIINSIEMLVLFGFLLFDIFDRVGFISCIHLQIFVLGP